MSASNGRAPGQPKTGVVGWKEVRVFVSSTFDDMHGEWGHLVKEVFPEMRDRCEEWKLQQVDIDLRQSPVLCPT